MTDDVHVVCNICGFDDRHCLCENNWTRPLQVVVHQGVVQEDLYTMEVSQP